MSKVTKSGQKLNPGGDRHLGCSLANTGVSSGDDYDLSGQIWDVLLCELRFRNEEVGTKGPGVGESSVHLESRSVLAHLGSSDVRG